MECRVYLKHTIPKLHVVLQTAPPPGYVHGEVEQTV